MTLSRAIFKNLLRVAKRYSDQRLPLTGLVGVEAHRFTSNPASTIRNAVALSPASQIDTGLQAIKQLQAQHGVLQSTGEGEQVAFAVWHQLLQEGRQNWASPISAADSLIWGSFAVAKMLQRPNPAEDLEESAVLELHAACHAASLSKSSGDRASVPGWKTFRDSICELASEVRQVAAPDLYPAEANAASAMPPPEVQQQQLLGITQTLFHKKRFRQDPFEWVYEGLDPLNVTAVLQTHKGISLSLAVLYISIARQLGIPMSMMPVVEAPAPQVEVPDAIRRRQATQTIATAPEPINWLVRTEWSAQLSSTTLQQPSSNLAPQDSSNQAQLQDQAWFADPRKGIVMSAAGVQQSLPHLQLDAPWLPDKPVMQVWAEFAHVAIVAHQRRGESDAVAFWMYQLMALDTMAEEWQQVMQPTALTR